MKTVNPAKCFYVSDPTENSVTFFKYKGRLINLPQLIT